MKICPLLFASSFLVGCASGSGSLEPPVTVSSVAPIQNPPASPPTNPAPVIVDNRKKFDTISQTYNLTPHGETTVTYSTSNFVGSSSFPKTDKYKIEDFGFFQATVKGTHSGSSVAEAGPEAVKSGPWEQGAYIVEANINGDKHKDFYVFEYIQGARDDRPNQYIHAFVNDGNGHFTFSNSTTFKSGSACIDYGSLMSKTDPNNPCGYHKGLVRNPLVADFNNDGIDDIYYTSILHLSNANGVLENKSLTNLPKNIFFNPEAFGPIFTHDSYAGHANNDKFLDIFVPIEQRANNGFMGDGSKHPCGLSCAEKLPWTMLINDGKGNFSANRNFPVFDKDFVTGKPGLQANTAAIADFDGDGYGDVAVGWLNPANTLAWNLGTNSSGAVFYNDGKNDWRKRAIVTLPANWYGANGRANDMEAFDFDGDGKIDIVLASTKSEPYYAGRVVQFFKNVNGTSFTDVTTNVHPGIKKYENGNGTPWWVGEGVLALKDFNHDGHMDIVDQIYNTYVLINDGKGNFTLYENYPIVGGGNNKDHHGGLYPVEIDGKYQYDFIGYKYDKEGNNVGVTTYYQVLDPPSTSAPSLYELMLDDFLRKPSNYTTSAAIANRGYTDLFYYSRWNSNNARVFSTYNNGVQTFGGTFAGNGVGLTVLNAKSAFAKNGNVFGADTDAVGIYANRGKLFAMTAFSHTKLNSSIGSDFFGTARASTTANTFGVELSFKDRTGPFSYSIGSRYNSTLVKGFVEQGADVNLRIADQHYNTANLVTTLDYTNSFNYKGIKFFYGADWEYLRYFYSNGDNVRASTGGSYTTVKGVNNLKREGSAVSLNAGAWFNPNTNMLFSVSNATKDPSYTVSVGYRF